MKSFTLLPLLLLLSLSACSNSAKQDGNSGDSLVQPSSDPAFNAAFQEWVQAKEGLKEKKCTERSCPVPAYPSSKPLLEEIRAANAKAEALFNNPAPENVGSWVRKEARDWHAVMSAKATEIEAAVIATEAKLIEVEPVLAPARARLAELEVSAAAEGCTLPPEGRVISCTGLELPLDSIDEARVLLREMETAERFVGAFADIVNAYATIPGIDVQEAILARGRMVSLNRYLTLMRPSFGTQVRELVKARWQSTVAEFQKAGMQAAYPASLDEEFQGEAGESMLRRAEASLRTVENMERSVRENGPEFTNRAIDRVRFVTGASSAYSTSAFQYHPKHERSLTVNLSLDDSDWEIGRLIRNLPSKTDSLYTERQAQIELWDKARTHLPPQEARGTLIPITIHVDEEFIKGLVEKMKLEEALRTVTVLHDAREIFSAQLDEALRNSGRALKGNERLLICDFATCASRPPKGTYVLELNSKTPEVTESRLETAARKIAAGL